MGEDAGSSHAAALPTPGWLRAIGTLLGVHVEYAQREALNDLSRLLFGLIFLALGGVALSLALAGLHAAVIIELHREYGWPWPVACGVLAFADVVIAVVLLLMGRARLRKPVLRETRALVRRTVTQLTEP